MVLAAQALLEHLELQHADHADDHALHARAELTEDLDGTLLRELLHALDELLALERIDLRDACEHLGRERGDRRVLHALFAGADGVADAEDARVEEAHDVARIGLVDDGAVVGHHRGSGRELELFVALHVEGIHAALELSRADAHEGDAVAMVLVHVGLDLEHKTAEVVARGLHRLAAERVGIGARRRREAQELLEEGFHAEVGERRAEEGRAELSGGHGVEIELVARAVEQLDVVHQVLVVLLADESLELGTAELGLDLGDLFGGVGMAVALEGDDAAALAIEHAAEVAARTDRPVHGIRVDAEHVLDLFHELKGVARLVVELVHEREDRDMAERADLEELFGLGLDALGAVDDHDRGVGGHERAVGVLRKVLVARGIEDVHAVALVGELQHRGGDGDAALLLDVHPVGLCVLGRALALDRAGRLDGAGIEQELFGEGGLARVGVRDDRERPARRDLFFEASHVRPIPAAAAAVSRMPPQLCSANLPSLV